LTPLQAAASHYVLRSDQYAAVIQDGQLYSPDEIRAVAEQAAARLIHFRGGRLALATRRVDAIVGAIQACQAVGCDLLLLRDALALDASQWRTWQVTAVLDDGLVATPLNNVSPNVAEAGILLPTSGTTGIPKIVRHHLGLLLMPLTGYAQPERRRTMIGYHPVSFAGLKVTLAAITSGGELIAVSDPTLPRLAEAAMQLAPDEFRGTPTIMRSLVSLLGAEAAKLPFARIGLAGETIDQALLDRLRTLLPRAELWQNFGASETGSFMTIKDGRAGFPARWLDEGIGPVRLRIVDGVMEVASPVAMLGYLGTPMRRPEDPPSWWRTGDMIGIEGDRAHFLGRADSVINVGGAKVRPEEVEQALLRIPGVADARVYGRPNPITGNLVAAEIAAVPGEDLTLLRSVILRAASNSLERHKVPQFLNIGHRLTIDPSGKKPRRI
jgi:acyl-coenzyme A synthetase/AMP-(fatty) acid ligase